MSGNLYLLDLPSVIPHSLALWKKIKRERERERTEVDKGVRREGETLLLAS